MQTLYAISRMVLLIGLICWQARRPLIGSIKPLQPLKRRGRFGIFSGSIHVECEIACARADRLYADRYGAWSLRRGILQRFLLGTADKSASPILAVSQCKQRQLWRLPTNGREMNQYLVKQVLDLGVYGVMFPMINSREEALNAIAGMRYPKAAGETDAGPQGVRGRAPGNAVGIGDCLWRISRKG